MSRGGLTVLATASAQLDWGQPGTSFHRDASRKRDEKHSSPRCVHTSAPRGQWEASIQKNPLTIEAFKSIGQVLGLKRQERGLGWDTDDIGRDE